MIGASTAYGVVSLGSFTSRAGLTVWGYRRELARDNT